MRLDHVQLAAPPGCEEAGLAVDGYAELDALAARLQAAGAPAEWDDRHPGVRRFYTADPVGQPGRAARPRRLAAGAAPGEDAERPER